MVTATESVPGIDPDRASFTIALKTARDTLTQGAGVITTGASRGRPHRPGRPAASA